MNTKKDLVYKLPLFTALAAMVVAVLLRVYQYFKVLDPETGFYNKIDFSVYLLYFVLGAAMVLSLVIFAVNKKKIVPVASVKKAPAFLVLSILLAVTVIVDSAGQLLSYLDLYEEARSAAVSSVSDYVKAQGGSLLLLQALFGAISAIYFFISGLSSTIGNADGSRLKIIALSPVVWTIFRLLYRFKRTISFINVSDLFLELFEIAFLLLFFLIYAQVVSKIDAPVVFWKLFAYGIPAAIFAVVCFLPRFIVTITGNSSLLSPHHGIAYSDFAVALFIAYNLITRVKAQLGSPDNSEE